MIAIGGPKKPGAEKGDQPPFGGKEEEPEEKEESGEMDSYLEEAFDALQDGDKEGFKLALRGALECM